MMRRAVGIVIVSGLVVLSGGTAGAEETFTFFGSGWGHGIGMSQYGAYGLAKEGWGSTRILEHYYRNTDVRTMPAPAETFRIGLLQSRSTVTFRPSGGSIRLELGDRVMARVGSGGSVRVERSNGSYRVITASGSRSAASTQSLRVVRSRGAIVSVPQWDSSVGRGMLVLAPRTSSMHLVAVLRPEAYLRGIAEVPSSWPAASLRSQAVAARTYAYRRVAANPRQRADGCACGLYASTRDQYYAGWPKEAGSMGARWVAAVKDTREQVVTYGGSPIPTYYSSSSGGFTENIEDVWVGTSPAPYLKGVCDPGDFLHSNPSRVWSSSFGASSLTSRLRSLTGSIGTVTGFGDYDLGVSGRVRTLRVSGTSGSKVVEGWDLRSALGLRDTRFRVNQNRNVTGRIRRAYDDLMCRPGLARADDVTIDGGKYQVFAEGRLYLNDARNDVVWLRGAVLTEYLDRGGHSSSLGLPVSISKTDDTWHARFQGGTIDCTPSGCSTT